MCRCVRQTGVLCISVNARYMICICAHVCALCLFSVGERGWGDSAGL